MRAEDRGGREERGREDRGGREEGGREDRGGRDDRYRGEDRGRSESNGRGMPGARRSAESGAPGEAPPAYAGESGQGEERRGRGRRRRRGRRAGAGRPAEITGGTAVAEPMSEDVERMESAEVAEGAERADRAEGAGVAAPAGEPAPQGGPMLSNEALAAEGKRWTEQFLKAMGFEATVRATAEGDRVNVTATVENDEQLLTGEKGEVRQSLQQLLNRMINRGDTTHYHLQLEINDFWERREAELRGLAKRLADDAVARNGEVITDYLNAQERRIIHVTLREDPRVKTYALGTGHIKRLAVAPANHPGGETSES
jgi:spoIIIJ-associated protein